MTVYTPSHTVLPSIMVLMVLEALAISTSTSNISPSELCSLIIGMVTYNLCVCEGGRGGRVRRDGGRERKLKCNAPK